MNVSSRTPEGEPNLCPVCGKAARLEPSDPPGDAACPHCGHLLWFHAPYVLDAELELPFFKPESRPWPPPPVPGHLAQGSSVRINDGPFENFTGIVDEIIEDRGLVRVRLTIFNRATPVELEYFQVE